MTTSLLDAIPQELVDRILLFLPDWTDRLHLNATCNALRVKTVESVFAHISVLWEGNAAPAGELENTRTRRSPRIDLLLRTMLEGPKLATYIKYVDLQTVNVRIMPKLFDAPDLDLVTQLKAYIADAGLPDPESWILAIAKGDFDVFVALFLAHCPNLHSLALGLDLLCRNRFLSQLLHSTIGPSRMSEKFPRLKSVRLGKYLPGTVRSRHIKMYDDPGAPNCRLYYTFFYCLALEKIEMNLLQPLYPSGTKHFLQTPQLASLRILQLRQSHVSPETLGTILSWTSGLVRLDYDFRFYINYNMSCDDLNQALSYVKTTLEHFQLRYIEVDGPDFTDIDLPFAQGRISVAEFRVLETLHISPCALFSWKRAHVPDLSQVLPLSLRHLCLHDEFFGFSISEWDNITLYKYLHEYFETINSNPQQPMLFRLDFVSIKFWFDDEGPRNWGHNDKRDDWLPEDDMCEVRDLCRRNNVSSDCILSTEKECLRP